MQKIKLITFDLNETLIKENTWKDLNLALGIPLEEDQRLFRQYRNKEITYLEWQRTIVDRYKKYANPTRDRMEKIIFNYHFLPGARKAVKYLQSKGYILAVISGSIDSLVRKVAQELGIKYYHANNSLVFDKKRALQDIKVENDEGPAKLKHLKKICRKLKISLKECACVGDGLSDIELFRKTGKGVTFKGSKVEKYAWKKINNLNDLQEIF
ncbi:MAG TPA: HAD-IB family phosphatase [Candidatus Dojkabacteria bacterium]|nr:HAD-IB family phosphatase [Candidatus Dojkabacteria bacterium]